MGSNSDQSLPASPGRKNEGLMTGIDDVIEKQVPVHVRDNAQRVFGSFIPSSYSAVRTATTTATNQSEAIATGATKVQVVNTDASNYVTIAFGTSAADAEANVAVGGVVVLAGQERTIGIPKNATHVAWLADTANVDIDLTQGV